jgi:alpha-tubulin suppressor-like RCC1 family protein
MAAVSTSLALACSKPAPPAEAPKAEASKAEASKAEAPKAEAPKTEAPKTEAPKAEAPKAEAPKAEAPTAEAPEPDSPKVEPATAEPAALARRAIHVVAGAGASCALMDDGTVRCWGRNDYSELGLPVSSDDAATPVQVPGITDGVWIAMGGDPGSSSDLACVGRKDGSVWCWGHQRLFPMEVSDGTPREVPDLKGVTQVALGGGTLYALKADGSVVGWGSQAFNAFGDSTKTGYEDLPITPIPGVEKAVGIAAGMNHACALKGDGGVLCWGYSGKSQNPTAVEGITDGKAIWSTTQSDDTCVSHADKSVSCWGEGQPPEKIPELADAVAMNGQTHRCALKSDRSVWCWGDNSSGQCGDGKLKDDVYTPVKVAELGNAVSVAAGRSLSCAALEDGTVRCWGANRRGALGDGTLMDRLTPTQVVGLNEATLPPVQDGLSAVQESNEAMDWSGMPEACKKGELTVALRDWQGTTLPVVSAYAQSQFDGKTVSVTLANYNQHKSGYEPPRGKQIKVGLRFAHVELQGDKKEAKPVDLGTYSLDHKGQRVVIPGYDVKTGDITLAALTTAGVEGGTATITHLDGAWICGELNVKAGSDSVVGPFAARVNGRP